MRHPSTLNDGEARKIEQPAIDQLIKQDWSDVSDAKLAPLYKLGKL